MTIKMESGDAVVKQCTLMISFNTKEDMMDFVQGTFSQEGITVYKADALDPEVRFRSRAYVLRNEGEKPEQFKA